jgi:bifunctional ADP-heptose synthase (sugar kinase/adenylyltransferase)
MMRKQDNFLENILWLKRRPKSKLWGQNVVIKGEHGALLFHDLQVSLHQLCLGGFDPTGAGDTLRVVLQDSLHK